MNIIKSLKRKRDWYFDNKAPSLSITGQTDFRPIVLFWLVLIFYVFYQLAMQPGYVLGGEMWAEMATNYFPNANAASYLQKLFSTDAGYIPAPQRIIALIGNQLNLPAATVPYFYTWSAIIITGMMVGPFCLPQFRKLIKSDALRFLVAISILMVADFEVRTFISFTYFSAFFVAIVTALAMVDDADDVPWWAWFIPVLMVSKPAVLAVLPAMILVAIVSKSRFRWIAVTVVLLCVGQILQMTVSATVGTMPFRSNEITFISKLIASGEYFFGFLGGYTIGHWLQPGKYILMLAGLFIFALSAFVIIFKKGKEKSLIIIGLSLLFFNVFLNAFALSDIWNRDMTRLEGLPVYRHIIVGFFGCILVVSGLFSELTARVSSSSPNRLIRNFGAILFLLWFICSGWLLKAGMISREPDSPAVNNSQWQNMAASIDSGASPLCVPVNPLGWMYQRNCVFLKPSPVWSVGQTVIANPLYLDQSPPAALFGKNLVAAAVLARPFSLQRTHLAVRMVIKLVDGSSR